MKIEMDPAERAVETLAQLATPPPPPAHLEAGGTTARPAAFKIALALVVLIGTGAATVVWRLSHAPAPPVAGASPPCIVERLTILGKPVEPKVLEVPGADAFVLLAPRLDAENAEPGGLLLRPAPQRITQAFPPGIGP